MKLGDKPFMTDSLQTAESRPHTMLIVEDHASVRKALRDWLGTLFAQSRLLEAESGEEAVALAAAERPDLILMDIGLPQMSGLEATRRIKKVVPDTQIVVLSLYEAKLYQIEASAAGASAYVSKRNMHADLLPILNRLVAGRA